MLLSKWTRQAVSEISLGKAVGLPSEKKKETAGRVKKSCHMPDVIHVHSAQTGINQTFEFPN